MRGIILLAAGYSRRFGAMKLAARMPDGRTLLQHSLTRAQQTGFPVVLVSRSEILSECNLEHLVNDLTLQLINSPDANLGMGHSLQAGVAAIADTWEACLVCLADMPQLRSETCRQLLLAVDADHIAQPSFNGQPGNPLAFGRRFFPELLACQGDRGARQFIKRHPSQLIDLPVDDPGILFDVDRRADLQQLREPRE